eukprot:TRINITY_DN15850_c0_g1_i3.p2 TRINITY_DN15850_c0_g1~~TRINITY_DN15850_c0_g1_i3.p2  ORF type:complete len:142 (-),score=34.91 TRINITY_DN15850_c0_g1_i3:221-646(-)
MLRSLVGSEMCIRDRYQCDQIENFTRGAPRIATRAGALEQLGEMWLGEELAGHVFIGSLSAGQKAKVVLAAAVWGAPQVIVLDEPTNFLDRDSLGALVTALRQWEGGLILVSHHRQFVEQVCDTLWLMSMGQIHPEPTVGA